MKITSPPKYHKQTQKSKSPFKTQSNHPLNNQKPIIHHLRSPSKISIKTQTNNSLKQNLYAELKSRQHQYVQLIKDLHQQNKNLKQQIVRLQHEQSHQFTTNQPIHLSPGRMSLNQTLKNTNDGFNVLKTFDNQKMMNKTFSNFTSPQKIQQLNNKNNNHHYQLTDNKSPFSKKPCIMSSTSPDGFRPVSSVRNTSQFVRNNSPSARDSSPCVRPASNYNLNSFAQRRLQTRTEIRTVNHSYQPSLISYNESFIPSKNQSLQPSPKKNLQIIHVLNTAVKSATPDKIVFKQTDSKPNNQSHLNPLTSKRHQANKSLKLQSPQKVQQLKVYQQKQQPTIDLDKKIQQNVLLSILKQRLQEGDFLNNQIPQQNIQESQCVQFIKPSEYNHNIRFSSDKINKQETQPIHIIHPLRRNILQGFPILNQLRMANSQYQQEGQVPVRQQPTRQQNRQVEIVDHKTKQSFNVKSQLSRESRLSAKISKQSQSKSLIEQAPSRKKPLTIIRMLEQHLNQQSQSQRQSIIGQTNFQSVQKIQSLTNMKKQKNNLSVNFVQLEKESIQNFTEIQNQNQNQKEQCYKNNSNVSFKAQQQQIVRHAHFSNRLYCQDTQEDIKVQSQKSIKQDIQQKQKSFNRSNNNSQLKHSINSNKVLSNKNIINPQIQVLQFNQLSSHQQKSFDFKSQPKDQSIEIAEDQVKSYKNSFVKNPSRLNQTSKYHHTFINKLDADQFNSSISQQLNKTSPNAFYPEKQTLQSKNKKYLDSNSISSNQYPSSSTLRSQKFKKISNQAYL